MHNRKILILCKVFIQHVHSTIKHNENKKWPQRKRWENVHQFSDYMATYQNAVVIFHTSGIISCAATSASYLTEPDAQSHDAGLFIRKCTFKMCVGVPEWTNTCKLQHFKICYRFCCRSRNQRMFCDKKRLRHPTGHIRRYGPPTAHYTSMLT